MEQQRRARRRRERIVYAAVAGVLAVAVGVALAVQHATSARTPRAVPVGAVADTTGGIAAADGMAIPVGSASAPVTLTVYDDPRCSACRAFDTTYGPAVAQLVQSGTLRLLVHPVTLIDANLAGTSGSLHAGNALACAQDAGGFTAYRDLLYTRQPSENADDYSSDRTLITLARLIPALDTPTFEACVASGRYDAWVQRNYADLIQLTDGRPATPTLYANGARLDLPDASTPQAARTAFIAAIDELGGVTSTMTAGP
ncbi:MAG TPA: thioredoxin domain-containing protein [Actinocrinis sp.]|nr:thioredoxin domain-containing protein [Actinocrinis sp.]